MHADMNIPVLNFYRRSIRPNFQPHQIFCGYILQRANPLARNQKSCIPGRHDLDGITVQYIADCLHPNFGFHFCSARRERGSIFSISALVPAHV